MDTAKPRPEPTRPPTPRDDLDVPTQRCPFCHDRVDLDADAWVSCRACQARHHTPCWSEASACAACGETRHLADTQPAPTTPQPTSPDLGRAGISVGLAAFALGLLGTLLSYQSKASRVDLLITSFEVGEPGLNALGMALVTLLTIPMALIGVGLGLAGLSRTPDGLGKAAIALNTTYLVAIVATAAAAW